MKRFHVHVAVNNLQDSIRFFSSVFGIAPTVVKDDYAKWMLEDPRVNFAISNRGAKAGIDHLGFQVDSDAEPKGLRQNLIAAQAPVLKYPIAAAQLGTGDMVEMKFTADKTFVPALEPAMKSTDPRELGARFFHVFVQ